jgi:hypothetical protein
MCRLNAARRKLQRKGHRAERHGGKHDEHRTRTDEL